MSEWCKKFETTLPGQSTSSCDLTNKEIKTQLIHNYPTLKKLIKYKDYDAHFIKRSYFEDFHEAKTDAKQIQINAHDQYNVHTLNELYFTPPTCTEPDNISVVDSIPVANYKRSTGYKNLLQKLAKK